MNIPKNLKYSKDHEWVKREGNCAIIGITDFAQKELGDIIYVDMEIQENEDVEKGTVFGSVEAVKTVSDLFSPISGKIIEFNTAINDNPEQVNKDPYNTGWIIKIEIKDDRELNDLLSVEAYKELIGQS